MVSAEWQPTSRPRFNSPGSSGPPHVGNSYRGWVDYIVAATGVDLLTSSGSRLGSERGCRFSHVSKNKKIKRLPRRPNDPVKLFNSVFFYLVDVKFPSRRPYKIRLASVPLDFWKSDLIWEFARVGDTSNTDTIQLELLGSVSIQLELPEVEDSNLDFNYVFWQCPQHCSIQRIKLLQFVELEKNIRNLVSVLSIFFRQKFTAVIGIGIE